MRGTAHSAFEVEQAMTLIATGLSDYEVARRTGLPRSTVLNWRRGRLPRRAGPSGPVCSVCGTRGHDPTALPGADYAYLLGQYLGDGTLFRGSRGVYVLKLASDARYADIIDECCDVIERIKGRRPSVHYRPDQRLATIASYWKGWLCFFPQHGRGRKHHRTIALAGWQVEIVNSHPGRFLRGLIHSDGWRGLNRVRVKGRDYSYPRYQFSSRSDDIRGLFTYACDLLGVAWRPWGKWHISVARREAVEILDRYVGPKS
jgi:hypothetical protein